MCAHALQLRRVRPPTRGAGPLDDVWYLQLQTPLPQAVEVDQCVYRVPQLRRAVNLSDTCEIAATLPVEFTMSVERVRSRVFRCGEVEAHRREHGLVLRRSGVDVGELYDPHDQLSVMNYRVEWSDDALWVSGVRVAEMNRCVVRWGGNWLMERLRVGDAELEGAQLWEWAVDPTLCPLAPSARGEYESDARWIRNSVSATLRLDIRDFIRCREQALLEWTNWTGVIKELQSADNRVWRYSVRGTPDEAYRDYTGPLAPAELT